MPLLSSSSSLTLDGLWCGEGFGGGGGDKGGGGGSAMYEELPPASAHKSYTELSFSALWTVSVVTTAAYLSHGTHTAPCTSGQPS